VNLADRVGKILACSALDQELSGLLFLDLDAALIYPLARWLADAIGDRSPFAPVTSGPAKEADQTEVVSIAAGSAEENLWERITLKQRDPDMPEDLGFRWAPGPLVGDGETRVVVIPDLAWAGLPVSRAAVTLVGAEVADLQRYGASKPWRPQDRWLAALRRQDAGRVSAHLLDRFSVRVNAGRLSLPHHGRRVLEPPPTAWRHLIQAVRRGEAQLPPMSEAAIEQVLTIVPARFPGVRRDLALARLARAVAAFDDQSEVRPGHVDEAASLVGLTGMAAPPPGSDGHPRGRSNGSSEVDLHASSNGNSNSSTNGAKPPSPDPSGSARELIGREPPTVPSPTMPSGTVPLRPASPPPAPKAPVNGWSAHGPAGQDDIKGQVPVIKGGHPVSLPPERGAPVLGGGDHWPAADDPLSGLYPEDGAQPTPDLAPLRVGWQRAVTGPPRGTPIGTQRALDARDIAVAATLLYAARFQRLRCQVHHLMRHHLHVHPADLRSYRRAPRPAALLVLVLDHSSRGKDWDWSKVLMPYLRWAYVNRALVGVVELGRDGGRAHELRATQFRSRGVLDPRIKHALGVWPKARATPLAHGLTLAGDMLRHDTQQAGGPVSKAYLVVVTDGRANVPLSDSLLARWPAPPVGQRGVTDARAAAGKISGLRRVRCVVLDPGPRPNAYLTDTLARALGGRLVSGAPDGGS
jgi:magnesium chelatase subunit D